MKFSIITPSFKRTEFLEKTILSVVSQSGDFEVEYIIQDGGSNFDVVALLDKWKQMIESGAQQIHCKALTYDYYIESDSGMYDAINKGFAKSTGDVLAWINSDDIYFPNALATIDQILTENSDIDWLIGQTACINGAGAVIYTEKRHRAIARKFVKKGYYRADIPFFNWLPQDSVFWRRSLWEKAGPLKITNRLVSDFKLWQSFAQFAEPVKVGSLIGAYRHHGKQLTANPDAYKTELGSPPHVPIGTQLACGCVWAIPQLPLLMRKLPGKYHWLKILGLEKGDVLGRMVIWDYHTESWVPSNRSTL